MKLRITGVAAVLALAVCLALLTTGASAQSMQKSATHRVVANLGGAPPPKAPAPRVATPTPVPRVATPTPAPRVAAPAPVPRVVAPAPAPRVVAPRVSRVVAPRVSRMVAPRVRTVAPVVPATPDFGIAPVVPAMSGFGVGIATSHALAGGFLGDGLNNGCGDLFGSGTFASGTAIGLGFGSGDTLGFGVGNMLG